MLAHGVLIKAIGAKKTSFITVRSTNGGDAQAGKT